MLQTTRLLVSLCVLPLSDSSPLLANLAVFHQPLPSICPPSLSQSCKTFVRLFHVCISHRSFQQHFSGFFFRLPLSVFVSPRSHPNNNPYPSCGACCVSLRHGFYLRVFYNHGHQRPLSLPLMRQCSLSVCMSHLGLLCSTRA